jgi:hypothetical protein
MHSVTLIPLPSRERVRVKGQKKYSSGNEEELKRGKGVRRQEKFGKELVTQSQKY